MCALESKYSYTYMRDLFSSSNIALKQTRHPLSKHMMDGVESGG